MTVLLIGGTGRLGQLIAEQLVQRNEPVRALVRTGKRAAHLRELGVQLEIGDLLDPRSLRRLLSDVRVVISAAQGETFNRHRESLLVDRQGHYNLIKAACDVMLEQFSYISALHAEQGVKHSKRLADKYAIEQALHISGIPYTVFRPAPFQDSFAPDAVLGRSALQSGLGYMPGMGKTKHAFIAASDVARAVVRSLDRREARNRVIPLLGPEKLSYREAFQHLSEILERNVVPVPSPSMLVQPGTWFAKPIWPNLYSRVSWAYFLERYGSDEDLDTPDWLLHDLQWLRRFDESMRAMYQRSPKIDPIT